MTSDEYPYLTQLSAPDRLRLAAYEAHNHGVAAIYLRAILDVAEELERFVASGNHPVLGSRQSHGS